MSTVFFHKMHVEMVVRHLHAVLGKGRAQVFVEVKMHLPVMLHRGPAVNGILDGAGAIFREIDAGSRVLQDVFRCLQSLVAGGLDGFRGGVIGGSDLPGDRRRPRTV